MLPTEALVDEVPRFCFFFIFFLSLYRGQYAHPMKRSFDDVGDADEVGWRYIAPAVVILAEK